MSHTENENPESKTPPPSRSVSKKTLLLLFVSSVVGVTLWKAGVSEMPYPSASQSGIIEMSLSGDIQMISGEETEHISTTATPAKATNDLILGTWTFSDSDAGRVIVNRDDGTATIDVTFGFLASFLYGSTLQLDLEWTLENNVLTHTIVGGSPESGKKALIRDYGTKTAYKILKLTDEKMHLMEFGDAADDYLWKRSAEE